MGSNMFFFRGSDGSCEPLILSGSSNRRALPFTEGKSVSSGLPGPVAWFSSLTGGFFLSEENGLEFSNLGAGNSNIF